MTAAKSTPTIRTKRLVIRLLRYEDLVSLAKHANNKKISDKIVNLNHPFGEPEAVFRLGHVVRNSKKNYGLSLAIYYPKLKEVIGEISLHVFDKDRENGQISYWIGEELWGLGFASEAVAGIAKHGFQEMGLNLVYADCDQDNLGSRRVLEKNGFQEYQRNGQLIVYYLSCAQSE